MAGLNKVILMGNLTADPEYKTTPTGTAVTTYGICPNCKEQVSICMDSGIKKCKCGQMLMWD